MVSPTPATPKRRLTLTLSKPPLGWFPKPTVVLDDRGQPAQWGVGTWQIDADTDITLRVFLFNRLWRFGDAQLVVRAGDAAELVYRAPWLPFAGGSLEVDSTTRS